MSKQLRRHEEVTIKSFNRPPNFFKISFGRQFLRRILNGYIAEFTVIKAIINERIELCNPMYYLDIGCGPGTLLMDISKKFHLSVGTDFSPIFCNMAMSNLQVREDKNNQDHSVYVIRNDVLDDLPFKNGTFDLVTATQVLEHIEDVYSVLNAIHRVVKNDGVLIMSVPNIAYLQRRIAFLFGHLPTTCIPRWRWPDEGWDGDHVNYFTLEAVKMLLSQTGFEYLGCRGSGYIAGFRSLWPSLLSADLIFYAKCKKRKL